MKRLPRIKSAISGAKIPNFPDSDGSARDLFFIQFFL